MNIQEDNLNHQERERETCEISFKYYVEERDRDHFNWYNFCIPSITSFQPQARPVEVGHG